MANILLVHPAGIFEPAEVKFNPSYPPLGLAYIASYLRGYGHQVKILDILGEGYNIVENNRNDNGAVRVGLPLYSLEKNCQDSVPDIIGVTNPYTKSGFEARKTARFFKALFSSAFIIMGGAHCSVLPEEVLSDPCIDAVCIGEGEQTMLELANAFDECQTLPQELNFQLFDIPGLAFMHNESIHHTPRRKLITDLDTIPHPARDLLPTRNYAQGQNQNPYYMRTPTTTLITSRGCPNNCIYCSVKSVWGRTWRNRSPKNIVAEIKYLIDGYNIREISVCDDAMACNQNRLKNICREIIAANFNIKWCTPNGIAIWQIDEECIDLMKQSGCYRLTFGLETGDAETMKKIRKRYSRKRAIELIKYANKKGLWTIGTFIIGFPWETHDSLQNTLKFAIASQVDFAVFYSAYPFPGTDLHTYYKSQGLSIPSCGSVTSGGVDTKHLTGDEIVRARNQFTKKVAKNRMLHFYRVLYKLRSFEDFLFLVGIIRKAICIAFNPFNRPKSVSKILKE